ncbi:MAG: DUF4255 domain-containing protein [Xanthomonadales bacterium]|nr:DUF4255 domain-containing protein [Xanthomonadales bacterium]
MSDASAIASVTAALFHLLGGTGVSVTTLPPRDVTAGNNDQLNLFLYGTEMNPAFRNGPMPGANPPGQSGPPPLALILRYLLTAYGDNEDFSVHETLGKGMLALHDNPILTQSQLSGLIPDAGLASQIEKIKITPVALTLDDMSKLWTSFQTEYRLSIAYEVSVVLIESTRPPSSPLPVLRRGEGDRGAAVMAAAAPTLAGLRFPNQKPAANLGDTVTLLGENLAAQGVSVRLRHPRLDHFVELEPEEPASGNELRFTIPGPSDDAAAGSKWPAGFYVLSVALDLPDTPLVESNALSLALSPEIVNRNPASAPAGTIPLTVECLPQIKNPQRVRLLFADREFSPDASTTPAGPTAPGNLQFTVTDAQARDEPYLLRLRVDGVDSVPVDFSGAVPEFDADQMVTVT